MGIVKDDAGEYAWDRGERFALMKASCHHHKRRKGFSACGGCYARAIETLSALAEDKEIPEAVAFIQEVQGER